MVLNDIWHLVLQRKLARYGDWSVGVHVNTDEIDEGGGTKNDAVGGGRDGGSRHRGGGSRSSRGGG